MILQRRSIELTTSSCVVNWRGVESEGCPRLVVVILTRPKHIVELSVSRSVNAEVKCGVLRGRILGPLLFILFMLMA